LLEVKRKSVFQYWLKATADINATTLADVPMGSVIVLLGTYVGFFYYLGIVLGAIGMIWATVNYS
jgi:hypothetical protein